MSLRMNSGNAELRQIPEMTGLSWFYVQPHLTKFSEVTLWHDTYIPVHENLVHFSEGAIKKKDSDVRVRRTHFLDKSTISRLRQVILLGATSGALPWRWNEQEYHIDDWSPSNKKLWRIQWSIISFKAFLLAIFNVYIFIQQIPEATRYREVFMSSNAVAWYACFVSFTLNTFWYLDQTREYINTLLQFNKKHVDAYLIHLNGFRNELWPVMRIGIPGGIFQVFISVSMFFAMSHLPFYLISYIGPQPWYWLIPGAVHQYIIYGRVITWFSLIHWISVAHASSVSFWLQETQ